ncbi:MAG TPA: hypothetical protein PL009_02365 [Flavipsychrobacter sp.]|nr:hypothetical protein [Flavipsychrobacter sp.]
MHKPLTLEQAQKICGSYQFLKGMPYDKDFHNATPILAVMIAPFQEQAQQEFMDDYDMLGYTDLKSFNEKDGYDVIVIARYQHDQEICLWMDVRSFVKRNMIQVVKYHKSHIISRDQNEVAA